MSRLRRPGADEFASSRRHHDRESAGSSWEADSELPGYQKLVIPLRDAPLYPGEPDHQVVATLVRRNQPERVRAMLYVHGWNDYFFQDHLADAVSNWGYDFYALDLRRYGRSLREGQLAGYTQDLREYYVELDAAVDRIRREGHDHLVIMGHSTGGLVVSMFVAERPGQVDALVLNSPWLEVPSFQAWRSALRAGLGALGSVSPTRTFSLPDPGFYRRTICREQEGEWTYNHNFKGDPAFKWRVGWMAAMMRGHAAVREGLGIEVPVLMLISARSDPSRIWNEEMRRADLVLDVETLAARAPLLSNHVTLIRVEGGRHDLVLSDAGPRAQFLEETRRWLAAYA